MRTGHPLAASGSEELAQMIEFVFYASPLKGAPGFSSHWSLNNVWMMDKSKLDINA